MTWALASGRSRRRAACRGTQDGTNTENGTPAAPTIGKERVYTVQERISLKKVALDIGTKKES